jgi:hypothetical protein
MDNAHVENKNRGLRLWLTRPTALLTQCGLYINGMGQGQPERLHGKNDEHKKILLIFLIMFLCGIFLFYVISIPSKEKMPVINAEAAVTLSKESWINIHEKTQKSAYSESYTKQFEPYSARLEGEYWVVYGSIPKDYKGLILETKVRRKDGSISVQVRQN